MTKEQVYVIVKTVISEVLPDINSELISIERNLKELGANSVDRMEVVTLSMEKLALKIPLMSFSRAANIEDLVDVLTEHQHLSLKN